MWHGTPVSNAIAAATPVTASVLRRRSRGAAQSTRWVSAKARASARSMAPLELRGRVPHTSRCQQGE
eukprot:15419383-Alexandrium_andersonii.AAC.1